MSTFRMRWLATCLLLMALPAVVRAADRPPNVIVFLADDLGWRDTGCYGSTFYETPEIDRLAAGGVRFTSAYSACHVCSPTRASLLTGRYPARLQLTDWLPGRKDFDFQTFKNAEARQFLPLEEITLAEALREHGYRTAHIGKWHLGEEPFGPLAQGFEVQVPRWNKGWPNGSYHAPFHLDGLADRPGDYLTDRLTDEAEKFIEDHADQPFFLYFSHYAVHDPLEGRAELVAKYEARRAALSRSSTPAFSLEGNPDEIHPLQRTELDSRALRPEWSGYQVFSDHTVKVKQIQDNPRFAAMVESLDESLGRVTAQLRKLNLESRTIIILTSDNGGMSAANFGRPDRVIRNTRVDEAFSTSNLPLRGGKGWLYEGGIRVPLIMSCPGQLPAGRICEEPVITTDLFPTILELAGFPIRPQEHLDGVSLSAVAAGTGTLSRDALFWHFPHYSNHGMQSPGGAVQQDGYKLLEYFERGTVQLFHLKQDPGEQHDLAAAEPDRASRMLKRLHDWRASVQAQMPTLKTPR